MRRICLIFSVVVVLALPAVARATSGWMPPLPNGSWPAERTSAPLALLARARVSSVHELPRTGGDPGLIALAGAGLLLAGAGLRLGRR